VWELGGVILPPIPRSSVLRHPHSVRRLAVGWSVCSAFLSKVIRSEASPPGDPCQHAGTDLFAIVKCEYIVCPPGTRKHSLRSTGLPLDLP